MSLEEKIQRAEFLYHQRLKNQRQQVLSLRKKAVKCVRNYEQAVSLSEQTYWLVSADRARDEANSLAKHIKGTIYEVGDNLNG